MNDDKDPKKDEGTEEDTEGHMFPTFDYYTERNRDRQAELDRDVRQRQQEEKAREAKKNRR